MTNDEFENEVWRYIPDTGKKYSVSNLGRVMSNGGHDGLGRPIRPKIFSQSRKDNGYCVVSLKRGDQRYVHRLVAFTFLSGNKSKLHVNHLNGDKSDNRACNLELTTRAENDKHKIRELYKRDSCILDKETGIYYGSLVELHEVFGSVYDWRYGSLKEHIGGRRSLKSLTDVKRFER